MLCDRCDHRAIPDGGGERIICRWYYLINGYKAQFADEFVADGDSPVDDYTEPEIKSCRAYSGESEKPAPVLTLLKRENPPT